MSDPSEWTLDDVLDLPRGESTRVEFKGSRLLDRSHRDFGQLRESLSRQLSAFANYDGGRLVIGVADPAPGAPLRLDGGVPVVMKGRQTTREWLEDLLPDLTEPRLNAFDVHWIGPAAGDDRLPTDRGVVVIDIRPGESAPYQANDQRYYGRIGGKARALTHRMVMDIVGRRRHPVVAVEGLSAVGDRLRHPPSFDLMAAYIGHGPPAPYWKGRLAFRLANRGRVVAREVVAFVYLPMAFVKARDYHSQGQQDRQWPAEDVDGRTYQALAFRNRVVDEWAVPVGDTASGSSEHSLLGPCGDRVSEQLVTAPLLPAMAFNCGVRLDAPFAEDMLLDEPVIHWAVFADAAPPQRGRVHLRDVLQTREPTR